MTRYCDICPNGEENDSQHRTSALHRFNYAIKEFHVAKHALSSSRHGVSLDVSIRPLNGFEYDLVYHDKKGTYNLDINPKMFTDHNYELTFPCKITNNRTKREDPIVLTYSGILHPYEHFRMEDKNYNIECIKEIKAGASYTTLVKLKLKKAVRSNFRIPIYFTIQTKNRDQTKMGSFSIARAIVIRIGNPFEVEQQINTKSPFTSNRWEKVPVRPPMKCPPRILDEYPIPHYYMKTLYYGLTKNFGDGVYEEIKKKLYPGYLTLENYKDYLHILIWLEEMCVTIGLSCYNMENVHLKYKFGDVLQLDVPGLAEKRPSVVKGDYIEIKIHGDHTAYRGVIQFVGDTYVDIRYLHEEILQQVHDIPNLEIDVRFVVGRLIYERMHKGVTAVVDNGYVKNLFPPSSLANRKVTKLINISESELCNKDIYRNNDQLKAVNNIVNDTSNGAPYIVFGPPGTGKTMTIVEAICQLKKRTNYKILVCAPSNAACNMLTEKLAIYCTTKELKRIMSENSEFSSVHESILPYCNLVIDDMGPAVIPVKLAEILKYRIIVTTLIRAGLYMGQYHPNVVFIDEAAQAREPEACVAMGLLGTNKTGKSQLVLAGDPKQLGPVIYSKVCQEYKYHVSLLERLMELDVYRDPNFLTMLRLNFRSHPEILRLPNHFFYDNQLQAISQMAINDPISSISVYNIIDNKGKLPRHGFPVEFCSVLSKERREGRSPSYFNLVECQMVIEYIIALSHLQFSNPSYDVDLSDIGVVTPYIRQVYKIRQGLQHIHKKYQKIDIGTTEAFQGREKRIMIISTVRGQEDLILYDQLYKLGFVGENKRFNVAVTRAKSKLIVIGNPQILVLDEKFSALMEQAKRNDSFYGAPFTPRNSAVRQDICDRITKVKLKDLSN